MERKSDAVRVNMLIEEADIGLTLLQVPQTNVRHRSRRVAEAHKAYKSALSLLERASPDETQTRTLENKMKALAEALEAAGVHVE